MLNELLSYIEASPTCFQAVDNVRTRLEAEGFEELRFGDWELKAGGRYYITRNGSSLVAFRIPEEEVRGFVLAAAHTDSPCLKLRFEAELPGPYVRLNAERYGGMINASWVDRPLSVAGRILVRSEEGVESVLVDMKKAMALIPNLAPHLDHSINEGVKYDPNKNLIALYGEKASSGRFYEEIAEEAGVNPEDILAADLYLYNNQKGQVWGPAGEFVSAPRLDDLACVFACTEAFLEAEETDRIPVLCLFDNEEIGSGTKQGAASELLPRTLRLISEGLFLSPAQHLQLIDNSWMLSCDNGHALHPNFPERSDKNGAPLLNGGVVLKHSPRYATDAVSAAIFTEVCRRAGVPLQRYSNRPDLAGGGTLGLIADRETPVSTVDIGIAQLAMHSSFETMGARDAESFQAAIRASYESRIWQEGDRILFR